MAMASKRTYTERKEEVQDKIAKLKALEKRLTAQEKAEKRKKARNDFEKEYGGNDERRARTHRLCSVGGAVESVLGREMTREGDIERLMAFLRNQNDRGGYFSRAMNGDQRSDQN